MVSGKQPSGQQEKGRSLLFDPCLASSMPRPKSILWVDDEVESLTSHILFLEEQGFAVETTTHGDDALVLLQRQPYGVVLLDEQMPGGGVWISSARSGRSTMACRS